MAYHKLKYVDEKLSLLIEGLEWELEIYSDMPDRVVTLTRLISTLKEIQPFVPKGVLSSKPTQKTVSNDLAGLAAREVFEM